VEGSCEYGNEASGSIECLEYSGIVTPLEASQERLSSMKLGSYDLVEQHNNNFRKY
jgi:hypothetical protein